MALINTQIKPFIAKAVACGEFVEVSDEHLKGKWSVFFCYPADFTFVCAAARKEGERTLAPSLDLVGKI